MSMPSIEDIKRVTGLGAFLYKGLLFKTYGHVLAWEDYANKTFCLRSIHKKKRAYTEEVEKIFKDYNRFQNRKKSKADKDGLRTNLLNAIKKNPYVALDEGRSSSDEKFCKFTPRFETVLKAQLVPDEEMELDSSFATKIHSFSQDNQYIGPVNESKNLDSVNNLSTQHTLPLNKDNFPICHEIVNQANEEKNYFMLEIEVRTSPSLPENASVIDPIFDLENMDPDSGSSPLAEESFSAYNGKMLTIPTTEDIPVDFAGDWDKNSYYCENPFIDENSVAHPFDVTNMENCDNKFYLRSEDEDQPWNTTGVLKESRC